MNEQNLTAPDEVAVPALALQLMAQNAKDAAFTTNTLIDGYERQIAALEAEIWLIQTGVTKLLDGPYAPSASFLKRALRPNRHEIARAVRELGATR